MNIKQAKEQIKQAVEAYRVKNEFGEPVIPVERQRPIFLMGAPGIGKTAIMEQIAQELGIGLVSYSMTHHTRQSALGLPFIVHKSYRGQEYDVSEYTMSEIISSVYERIEKDGAEEGILFLDEINCVSETLAPSMLQFLQYKTFGRHRVPDGWIVVTAGNPPEYNDSVREFDIVTWDRLKRVDVEPEFDVWKDYASSHGVHPAVLTYLEIKKEHFYSIETTVDGKSFVTARGWVDLSDIMKIYEKKDYAINEMLIRQYIQNAKIAKSFAVYYDLFKKYRSDYQVNDILEGKATLKIEQRAMKAKFDERLSVLGLLLDAVYAEFGEVSVIEGMMRRLMDDIRALRAKTGGANALQLTKNAEQINNDVASGRRANSLGEEEALSMRREAAVMENMAKQILKGDVTDSGEAFKIVKAVFDEENANFKESVAKLKQRLENMFAFCEKVFPDGQEILILVTELTRNTTAARFISKYGCDAYFRHNKNLLFYERQQEIMLSIDSLEL